MSKEQNGHQGSGTLRTISMREIGERVLRGTSTVSELIEVQIEEIGQRSASNALITETSESARLKSEIADQRIKVGDHLPLDGITYVVEDRFCTKGIKATVGSNSLRNFVPQDDAAIIKLNEAGSILLGKSNMDEFGFGASTENSLIGPTINPIGQSLGFEKMVAGGYSGGAAAAISAGLATAAIGTDMGGSIRLPASYCGIVGMKSTPGLLPTDGIFACATTFSHVGAFGRSVEDVAIFLDVLV